MNGALTEDHRCSRESLCFHEDSPQSSLEYASYESTDGIAVRSQYTMPGWGISLIVVGLAVIVSVFVEYKTYFLKLELKLLQ